MSVAKSSSMLTQAELRARIAELAAAEAEALEEKDQIRFRDLRGKRNWLESQVKGAKS